MKTWIQVEDKKRVCCDFSMIAYDYDYKACYFTVKDPKCRIKKEINEKFMVAETLKEIKEYLDSVNLEMELVQTYRHFVLYNIIRKRRNNKITTDFFDLL